MDSNASTLGITFLSISLFSSSVLLQLELDEEEFELDLLLVVGVGLGGLLLPADAGGPTLTAEKCDAFGVRSLSSSSNIRVFFLDIGVEKASFDVDDDDSFPFGVEFEDDRCGKRSFGGASFSLPSINDEEDRDLALDGDSPNRSLRGVWGTKSVAAEVNCCRGGIGRDENFVGIGSSGRR